MNNIDEPKKKLIGEIEGMRVLAALLVAVYHIWFQKVSGGVDIFFLVSGFLITTSLYSVYQKNGEINGYKYLNKLMFRLLPHIFIILTFIIITFSFFLNNYKLTEIITGTIFTSLYLENWHLALTYNSYLDRTNNTSVFQHFWAMSIQGQFYVVWILVFIAAIKYKKYSRLSLEKLMLLLFSVLFFTSLIFSIFYTNINQTVAYYITPSRLYEFAVGGMLALVYNKLIVSSFISSILSYVGICLILGTGLFINVEEAFPSYFALVPILGALAILISSKNDTRYTPNRILRSRFFVKAGRYTYPFYLWHWVVYIYFASYKDSFDLSFFDGLLIIMISIIMAFVFEHLISYMNIFFKYRKYNNVILTFLMLLASTTIVTTGYVLVSDSQDSGPVNFEESSIDLSTNIDYSQLIESNNNPGALVHFDESLEIERSNDVVPSLVDARGDIGTLYQDNCNQVAEKSEIIKCDYGNTDADVTIALIGGSHTVQWFDAFKIIADNRNIHLVTMTKLACRFTAEELADESCIEWNNRVIDDIQSEKYDLVITNADISTDDYPEVPEGYITQFEKLDDFEVPVLALRDTPWFTDGRIDCLEAHGLYNGECNVAKDKVLTSVGKWELVDNPPRNVHYADLTDIICDDEICNPIQGNVIIYWDSHHMTSTYVKTMTPFLDEEIKSIFSNG